MINGTISLTEGPEMLINNAFLGWIILVQCALDRFTKELFWNFKECQVVSMEAYQDKQMSEKKFFSNVAPSPSSGTPKSRKMAKMTKFKIVAG